MLLRGNCLELLTTLGDCSVDSIVTDPPYELGFMGKHWDNSGIAHNVKLWAECLRVLKPGGHLLAFGGTRTYHRMACAIEDAGFEIRDSIHWTYGSGFPKSLNVGKAIDKGEGENRDRQLRFTEWMRSTGITAKQIDLITGTCMGAHYTTHPSQPAIATADMFDALRPHLPEVPEEIERLVAERTGIEWPEYKNRPVVGAKISGIYNKDEGPRHTIGSLKSVKVSITTSATDAAKQWDGWGTALKPSHEPIVVARKPLTCTVAANVQEWGTGALNIDGCRVGYGGQLKWAEPRDMGFGGGSDSGSVVALENTAGRWPANTILTHHPDCESECVEGCPCKEMGEPSRFFTQTSYDEPDDWPTTLYYAKASSSERGEFNHHPTVKPVALMRHLVRLVTPPNGTVLDPFLGSGTTAVAAVLEGFDWVGCELTPDYWPIIESRVQWAEDQPRGFGI